MSALIDIIDKTSLYNSMMIVSGAVILSKLLIDYYKYKENSEKLNEAERKAFDIISTVADKSSSGTHEGNLNEKETTEIKHPLNIGKLFNLYSKQIEKYQDETRSRASWSFIFAIISMFLGMTFLFWGGSFVLSEEGATHVTVGASIAAIGGGISAYITKTFLDVHKLSLTQLNRYFKQPVINDNILMAQRLADEVDDIDIRKQSYEKIIKSITMLIDENGQKQND